MKKKIKRAQENVDMKTGNMSGSLGGGGMTCERAHVDKRSVVDDMNCRKKKTT